MPSLKNPKADLRSKYSRYLKIGLIFALGLIIISFKLSPDPVIIKSERVKHTDTIFVEPPIRTTQETKVPPPPKAPQIVTASIDDIVDDFILDDIDEVKPVQLPDKPPSKPKIVEDDYFFEAVEEMPTPIGGIRAIEDKVHYTEIARRALVEGTVYIEARIDKKGNIIDAIVKKGLGAGLDEEALNAVLLTKFIPGKQRGKPVNVKIVIPIKFVLK